MAEPRFVRLLDALVDYLEERERHDTAQRAADFDWSYYGQSYREALARAEERVEAAFVQVLSHTPISAELEQ